MAEEPQPKYERTSEVLKRIIDTASEEPITVREFVELLGERAFALVILVFALPNSLPLPGIPGVSTITGLPIAFIALQMILGREAIWLPDKVAYRRLSPAKVAKFLNKAIPAVVWLEKFLMPRWHWIEHPLCTRLLGLLFLILALVIALPIPGGNFLPGLSMALLALGMLERDGLFVACAVGFSLLSLKLMQVVIVKFFKVTWRWMGGWF